MADPIVITLEDEKYYVTELRNKFSTLKDQWSYLYKEIDSAITEAFSGNLEERVSLIENTLRKELSFEEVFQSFILNLVFGLATEGFGKLLVSFLTSSSAVKSAMGEELGNVTLETTKITAARKYPSEIMALGVADLNVFAQMTSSKIEGFGVTDFARSTPSRDITGHKTSFLGWLFHTSVAPALNAVGPASIQKKVEQNKRQKIEAKEKYTVEINSYGSSLVTFLTKKFRKQGNDIDIFFGEAERSAYMRNEMGDFSDLDLEKLKENDAFYSRLISNVQSLRSSDLLISDFRDSISSFLWARWYGGNIFNYFERSKYDGISDRYLYTEDPPKTADELWGRDRYVPGKKLEYEWRILREPKDPAIIKTFYSKYPPSTYAKVLQQDVQSLLTDPDSKAGPGKLSFSSSLYKETLSIRKFSDAGKFFEKYYRRQVEDFLLDLYFRRLYFGNTFRSEYSKLFMDLNPLNDSIPEKIGQNDLTPNRFESELAQSGPFSSPSSTGPFKS